MRRDTSVQRDASLSPLALPRHKLKTKKEKQYRTLWNESSLNLRPTLSRAARPFLARQRQDVPDKVTTVFTVRYIILPGGLADPATGRRHVSSVTQFLPRTATVYDNMAVCESDVRDDDGPLHGITIPAVRQGWRARFINRLQQRITRTPRILLPPSDLPLTLRGNILRRPVDDPKLIFKSVRTVPRAPRLGSS